LLEEKVAWLGSAPVRALFRVDLNALANLNFKGLGGDEEANQIVAQWIKRAVQNWELVVGWAMLGMAAHVSMIIILGVVLGKQGAPIFALLIAEVVPGVSVGLYMIKFGISTSLLLRYAKAVGAAERQGVPAPAWTKRRGIFMVLTTPGDWDLLVPIAVAIVIGLITSFGS
jgi:hypothetical protein